MYIDTKTDTLCQLVKNRCFIVYEVTKVLFRTRNNVDKLIGTL